MSFQVSTASVQEFKTIVSLLLQQQGSRLRPAVNVQAFVGKAVSVVEQFGPVTAVRNSGRHSDTPLISTPQDRRWCFPNDYDWADLIDRHDKLRMLIDPTSAYCVNGSGSLGRAMDDEIIAGFFNSNKTGSSGNTGLNIAKLRMAKRLLLSAEVDVDNDPLYMAITAKQHDDLLNEAQAISLDYNSTPVLVNGRINAFMGFNFINSERIPGGGSFNTALNPALTVPAGQNFVPFWAKSGVCLGIWNDLEVGCDIRPDKRRAQQVFLSGTYGATRLEEKRCGYIVCA